MLPHLWSDLLTFYRLLIKLYNMLWNFCPQTDQVLIANGVFASLMTSSTELNNSCASLAGHSINQKMPNLNNQFLTSGDFGGKASEIISSSFNDNNSNMTLTSSVESSGIASASEVTMDVRGDEEGNDSSCYTHSQCTPDECWIMVSRSSFLTDKQNSDADLWSRFVVRTLSIAKNH